MRRGSIVGPLILILLGTLFLLNNLRPDLSLIRLMADNWPYLLIVWGVLRLMEVIYNASRGRPLPAQGVGGGEWFLVILLSVFGTAAFAYHNNFSQFPSRVLRARILGDFGDSYDYTLDEKKVTSGKAPRVIVENLRGNARIFGVEGATEVKVTGRKTVRALQQADADRANAESPLEVVNQNDLIVIRTNQERVSTERRVTTDLEISVPKGATIQGRGRNGDFDIADLTGNVEITSDNAGVRVQNIDGDVRADLRRSDMIRATNVKGVVDLKGRGQAVELQNIQGPVNISGYYTGDLLFRNLAKPMRYESDNTQLRTEAIPGEMRLARGFVTGSRIAGPISIIAKNKDVQMTDFTESLEVRIERGDIEIHPGHVPIPRIDARSQNGDIDLALPEKGGFDLRAEVDKGEITNLYSDELAVQEMGRGARLQAKVGSGAPIVLSADRGQIQIRKGSMPSPGHPGAAPAPPRPPKIPTEEN